MSCVINIKWLEGVWATTTIGGRVNRRDKKAATQMNARSITDSQLDSAHVGLIGESATLLQGRQQLQWSGAEGGCYCDSKYDSKPHDFQSCD